MSEVIEVTEWPADFFDNTKNPRTFKFPSGMIVTVGSPSHDASIFGEIEEIIDSLDEIEYPECEYSNDPLGDWLK